MLDFKQCAFQTVEFLISSRYSDDDPAESSNALISCLMSSILATKSPTENPNGVTMINV